MKRIRFVLSSSKTSSGMPGRRRYGGWGMVRAPLLEKVICSVNIATHNTHRIIASASVFFREKVPGKEKRKYLSCYNTAEITACRHST